MQLTVVCLLVIVTQLPIVCYGGSVNQTQVATIQERQLAHWLATEISHGVFLYFKWSFFARITKCIVDTIMKIVALSQLNQYTVLMSLLYNKLYFTITYWFNHLPHELLQLLL